MGRDMSVLTHFYRASVAHGDVWRQRLDATTNWAVLTTAAVVTFAFGDPARPHFVLLLALVFATLFLVMESRRYQAYHVWRQRVQSLHRFLVAPALLGEPADVERIEEGLGEIAAHLASSRPRITMLEAIGYRIRRNYGPLFTVVILTWGLRLWSSPVPATSVSDVVERAAVGVVPGSVTLVAVAMFFVACVAAAITAPSEVLVDWESRPSPVQRLIGRTDDGSRG